MLARSVTGTRTVPGSKRRVLPSDEKFARSVCSHFGIERISKKCPRNKKNMKNAKTDAMKSRESYRQSLLHTSSWADLRDHLVSSNDAEQVGERIGQRTDQKKIDDEADPRNEE